jgi:formate-dependent nitrite reductase membrane component NrfD
MSAVIALAAVLFHHVDVARAAMWLAAITGAILSPMLLIMDLGRPHLFLNMLRVFKHRSAMSMGAWILSAAAPFRFDRARSSCPSNFPRPA